MSCFTKTVNVAISEINCKDSNDTNLHNALIFFCLGNAKKAKITYQLGFPRVSKQVLLVVFSPNTVSRQ